jgi:D-alanine-D-alanine ligase
MNAKTAGNARIKGSRNAAILFGHVPPEASLDEQDVLQEVGAISAALTRLGFLPVPVPLTLDVRKAVSFLKRIRPLFVFNLVESVEGKGQLIYLAQTILEYLALPYTGAGLEAMFLTTNKVLAKKVLAARGLPTPLWVSEMNLQQGNIPFEPPYIIKHLWEHASVGVDERGIIYHRDQLRHALDLRPVDHREHLYAEAFIDGREFNLALLGSGSGLEILPPSEILFVDYPEGKPRIVDYRAKWVEASFEYEHTPRTFDFPPEDGPAIERMKELAAECWRIFGLRGYARVDFRLDGSGCPWIMEINANPCINPDSGFVATAERAGLDYTALVRRILLDSVPETVLNI